MYAERINKINESQTAQIAAIAIQMRKENIDVVDFTVVSLIFQHRLTSKMQQ